VGQDLLKLRINALSYRRKVRYASILVSNCIALSERPLKLSDVAVVTEASAPGFSGANIMGKPGVLLEISSQYGTNTLEVTK
jgi:multidrug efflux pump subunit AcrB